MSTTLGTVKCKSGSVFVSINAHLIDLRVTKPASDKNSFVVVMYSYEQVKGTQCRRCGWVALEPSLLQPHTPRIMGECRNYRAYYTR